MEEQADENAPEHTELVQEPTEITPEVIEPKPARKDWKSIFRNFNKNLNLAISIFFKVGGLVLFVLVCVMIYREWSYDGYSLQKIHVPKIFEEAGYSGEDMALKIQSKINKIKDYSQMDWLERANDLDNTDYTLKQDDSNLEISMVGIGLPVQAIINYTGNALGLTRSKRITAFAACSNATANMILYIQDAAPQRIQINFDSLNLEKTVDDLATAAAKHILKVSNPELLVFYMSRRNEIADSLYDLCRYAIKHGKDSSRNKFIYSIWGLTLADEGNYDEAIKTTMKGLAIDPESLSLNAQLITLYRLNNRHREAKAGLDNLVKIQRFKRINQKTSSQLDGVVHVEMLNYYVSKQFLNKDSAIYHYHELVEWVINNSREGGRYEYILISPTSNFADALSADTSKADQSYFEMIQICELRNATDLSFAYNEAGYYFSKTGRLDTATYFVKKGITADSTEMSLYTTLAEIHSYKKETEKFYYNFEKAMKFGWNPEWYPSNDPPYSYYSAENRYKDLLNKYRKKTY